MHSLFLECSFNSLPIGVHLKVYFDYCSIFLEISLCCALFTPHRMNFTSIAWNTCRFQNHKTFSFRYCASPFHHFIHIAIIQCEFRYKENYHTTILHVFLWNHYHAFIIMKALFLNYVHYVIFFRALRHSIKHCICYGIYPLVIYIQSWLYFTWCDFGILEVVVQIWNYVLSCLIHSSKVLLKEFIY